MNHEFWRAAGMRALRTVCQAFLAGISTAALISEVNWLQAASAAALAGIISLLTSIATGLPEA